METKASITQQYRLLNQYITTVAAYNFKSSNKHGPSFLTLQKCTFKEANKIDEEISLLLRNKSISILFLARLEQIVICKIRFCQTSHYYKIASFAYREFSASKQFRKKDEIRLFPFILLHTLMQWKVMYKMHREGGIQQEIFMIRIDIH